MSAIGAIVVTYHTGRALKDCLNALAVQSDVSELVIVNNGNPPEMCEWLERFSDQRDGVKLIEAGANLGFGRGVNLGVAACQALALLIINPDCVLRPDALGALVAASKGRRSPALIGGRIFDIKGDNQRGPMRRELTASRLLSKLTGGAGINLPLEPQPTNAIAVDVTSGAFFLIDRAGYDRLGGFDEDYFLHVEDIDLCKRVHLAGGEVIYQPHAGALHYGATSDVSSVFVERHKAAGFARYLRKFSTSVFSRLLAELLIPLVFGALMMRAWLADLRRGR